jgi:PHD/YefM family antitoxin component YafN of YafNO toxin-antitoxin module
MTRNLAATQQTATSSRHEARHKSGVALEEELEEANVTDLRSGLLPTIERIQENPAIRVVIRKHGKRRAVLMSAATYDALMHVANLFIRANDRLAPQDKLEAAYQRLESGSSGEQASSSQQETAPEVICAVNQGKEVKILLESAQQILRELDMKLGANS